MTRHLTALPDLPGVGDVRAGAPDLRAAIDAVAAKLAGDERDAPLLALARRYAREIEQVGDLVEHLDALARISAARRDDESDQLIRRVDALAKRVELLDAVVKIGPLLHKALHDLGGAPVARKSAAAAPAPAGRLAGLRSGVSGDA